MQIYLKHYIQKIKKNTELNTEMKIARDIQFNLIPKIATKLQGAKDRRYDNLHWFLEPAKEIGGEKIRVGLA